MMMGNGISNARRCVSLMQSSILLKAKLIDNVAGAQVRSCKGGSLRFTGQSREGRNCSSEHQAKATSGGWDFTGFGRLGECCE